MSTSPIHTLAAVVIALGVAFSTASARSADEAAEITIGDVRLGPRVTGPAVAPQNLVHRVVVLEFWGVNCPPCIKSMPDLEALHRRFAAAGLVVIGAHAQQASPEEIGEVVRQLGVSFPIVETATVDGGMGFPGIPHCMVFDHTGTCVFRGHPNQAHDVIAAAVKSSPAAVLEGRDLVKLAPLAAHLRDESTFGVVLRKARGLVDSKDSQAAAEAEFVVEKLEGHADRLLADADKARTTDPVRALHYAQRCASAYRGTEPGKKAADLLATWKKDRGFQDGVEAARQCRKLEMARARIVQSLGGPETMTPELAARVPEPVRKQLAVTAESVRRLSPGSASAERAAAIAGEFGLDVVP
jgi:thiol-disulfide isomerase/thioredoxin